MLNLMQKQIVLEKFSRFLNLISIRNVKLNAKKGMKKDIFLKNPNFLGFLGV